jgi:hypothetical protein
MAWRRANDRAFDLDRIRRNAAALRRRDRVAEQLRVIVPVGALALTGYLAIQHLVMQDLPALQAIIDRDVAARCTAMACECLEDVAPARGQASASRPTAVETALYADSAWCGFLSPE